MNALSNTAALPVAASANALALPPVGNIEAYISAAHRFPLLTAEREQELARRLRDNGDLEAAREMVMSHLRLVVSISRQYLGYGLPHSDLIQEGSIGLMKAVKRFDPDRGVRLVSFAMHWIKAEIHEFVLRNWRLVKVATTKAQRKLFFNLRSMKTSPGTLSPDEVATIAADLNVKTSDVIEMETRLGGQDVALDKPADDEDGYSPLSYLVAPEAQPDAVLESLEHDRLQTEGIRDALASLDERSRRIVEARWLRDEEDGGGVTLQELGAEYGVSAERIRQIEAKALKTMRSSLVQYE